MTFFDFESDWQNQLLGLWWRTAEREVDVRVGVLWWAFAAAFAAAS